MAFQAFTHWVSGQKSRPPLLYIRANGIFDRATALFRVKAFKVVDLAGDRCFRDTYVHSSQEEARPYYPEKIS